MMLTPSARRRNRVDGAISTVCSLGAAKSGAGVALLVVVMALTFRAELICWP